MEEGCPTPAFPNPPAKTWASFIMKCTQRQGFSTVCFNPVLAAEEDGAACE